MKKQSETLMLDERVEKPLSVILSETVLESATVTSTLALARKEITAAWRHCKRGEKKCVEFGKTCYEWQERLRPLGHTSEEIAEELGAPRQTVYRWINRYLEEEGLLPATDNPDRTKTNADIIVALVRRLKNTVRAVERVSGDWKGWTAACPPEMESLKAAIGAASEVLARLA